MESNTAQVTGIGSYQKEQLIQRAHQALVDANRIDERDDLDQASWVEWYDRVVPEVKDIKVLAGEMEIELTRRRGERILVEGERRGGDQKSGIKVTPEVTLISDIAKKQRSEARLVASEPQAVTAYREEEKKAGRAPTVKGAVRAARAARESMVIRKNGRSKLGPATPLEHPDLVPAVVKAKVIESDVETIALVDRFADGERYSDAEISKITGISRAVKFIRTVRLLPWLTIDRSKEGTTFCIDEELRAICENRRPRPELSYKSINEYLATLLSEIRRLRAENNDEFRRSRWNDELIRKRKQSDLLDWIEQQLQNLDRTPTL